MKQFFKLIRLWRDATVMFALLIAKATGNILGISGGVLIVIGYLSEIESGWIAPRIEAGMSSVSSFMTLVGTILTLVGLYAPPNKRPVSKLTQNLSAPASVLICIGTFIYWVLEKRPNDHVLNGIAMIGVATAILRLLSQDPE